MEVINKDYQAPPGSSGLLRFSLKRYKRLLNRLFNLINVSGVIRIKGPVAVHRSSQSFHSVFPPLQHLRILRVCRRVLHRINDDSIAAGYDTWYLVMHRVIQ
ncbi:hypothetical protein D3C85_753600 [compost metagenome]